ncbi:hypothetical protein GTP91_26780 [Rugamonas sp. FT82W]|uniref:Uncharacterized protein n=1 Tax=Duganella vulcania TaxID=2692166 RepID=A0A845GBI8_9BURK|nr:hypothetical protein [Duganella vulcania]MYM90765.1 hypothetical protein [Duganella vulcania]
MISANPPYSTARSIQLTAQDNADSARKALDAAPAGAVAAEPEVAISSLAGRLSRAAGVSGSANSGLSRNALAAKVQANIDVILYPLDDEHKAAAAREVPEPNDALSAASASAATAYVDDTSKPNPFAGLSREQLSTISNDESGTFTINEKRAAFMQAYDEEQAWRRKVVEQASREWEETGKQTEFFKQVRAHFLELPQLEQVLYPANYANDLAAKIGMDAGIQGPPAAASLRAAAFPA